MRAATSAMSPGVDVHDALAREVRVEPGVERAQPRLHLVVVEDLGPPAAQRRRSAATSAGTSSTSVRSGRRAWRLSSRIQAIAVAPAARDDWYATDE